MNESLIEGKTMQRSIKPVVTKLQMSNRSIFTDWMRALGIYLVVFVHIFVSLRRTINCSQEEDQKIDSFFRQLLQFGMPIFFYFSGRSSAFSRDNYIKWLYKKFMRLLLPTIFCTLIIVIPTAYIGRMYRPQTNQGDISFWVFYAKYFPDEFTRNGFEWLWFLPVLFGISVVNYPFIKFYKNSYKRSWDFTRLLPYEKWDWIYIGWMSGQIILGAGIIGGFINYKWIILIFVAFCPYFSYFILLKFLPLMRNKQLITFYFIPCIFFSILLAFITKYFDGYEGSARNIFMMFYYNLHYVMGFSDQLFYDEYKLFKQESVHLKFRPISFLLLILLLALCAPGTNIDVGYIWVYPLYESPLMRVLYVSGTWIWIAVLLRWCQTYYNEELHAIQFKFFKENSMVTYLVHWLWMEIANRYIIYENNINLVLGFFILLVCTMIGCYVTYLAVIYIPFLGLIFGIDQSEFKKKIQKTNLEFQVITENLQKSNNDIVNFNKLMQDQTFAQDDQKIYDDDEQVDEVKSNIVSANQLNNNSLESKNL